VTIVACALLILPQFFVMVEHVSRRFYDDLTDNPDTAM